MTTFTQSINVRGKTFEIIFNTEVSYGSQYSRLTELESEYTTEVANEVVQFFISAFGTPKNYFKLKYESTTPFFIYHDLCHALYTSHLFFPKVITIVPEDEKMVYEKSLELATTNGLAAQYITSIPQLKEILDE